MSCTQVICCGSDGVRCMFSHLKAFSGIEDSSMRNLRSMFSEHIFTTMTTMITMMTTMTISMKVTYSTPCAAPDGVDCVDNNECPAIADDKISTMVTMLTIFLMAMVCQDKCWNSFYLKYWQSKPISHYFLFHRYASLWLESSFIWTRGKLGRMDTTTSPAAGEENNNNYKQLTRIVEGTTTCLSFYISAGDQKQSVK